MQTPSEGQKHAICVPTLPFMNANQKGFTKRNPALVNYHFWFSDSSTRFPCVFLHPTLITHEIRDFKRFLRSLNLSVFDNTALFIGTLSDFSYTFWGRLFSSKNWKFLRFAVFSRFFGFWGSKCPKLYFLTIFQGLSIFLLGGFSRPPYRQLGPKFTWK